MRIASLLPSATEIVCSLGAREMLLGVSHECDFPPAVSHLPILTRPRYSVPPSADREAYANALAEGQQSHSAAINNVITALQLDALSPYLLDRDLLANLQPDLVLTQDLCEVCAPDLEEVRRAVRELCGPQTRVLSLTPQRLGDIWENVRTVGAALGLEDVAETVTQQLELRLAAVRVQVSLAKVTPRTILTIEWFDPVMNSGLWMPELVECAGGFELEAQDPASGMVSSTQPGERSRVLAPEEVWQLDPDVIVLKPCGFKLEAGLRELPALDRTTPWHRWRAVRNGEAYLMDGSAYFNRPGPRIAESCELLAAALHPALFPQIQERHRYEVLRIGPGFEAAPW